MLFLSRIRLTILPHLPAARQLALIMRARPGMLRIQQGGGGGITIFFERKSQGPDVSQKRAEEDHETCEAQNMEILQKVNLLFLHGPGVRNIRVGHMG